MSDALLDFFKAMADESRLSIVGLLTAREMNVQELARALDLKEPTVSHHLAILKAQGLVNARAEGTTRWHSLDKEALERLARSVLKPMHETKKAETFDAKVLNSFVAEDGTIKSIPASRKKRTIVLRWLMRDFVEGRRYPEAEVNEAIQAHHWDSATLRRELVGHHMLARKDRVYWRLPESEWQDGGMA